MNGTYVRHDDLLAAAIVLRRKLEVSVVSNSKACCLNEAFEVPIAKCEHVLDHLRGRSDLSVAVVPSQFDKFDQVQGHGCLVFADDGNYSSFPFLASFCSTDRHRTHCVRV